MLLKNIMLKLGRTKNRIVDHVSVIPFQVQNSLFCLGGVRPYSEADFRGLLISCRDMLKG
jgi:hypothetical protein